MSSSRSLLTTSVVSLSSSDDEDSNSILVSYDDSLLSWIEKKTGKKLLRRSGASEAKVEHDWVAKQLEKSDVKKSVDEYKKWMDEQQAKEWDLKEDDLTVKSVEAIEEMVLSYSCLIICLLAKFYPWVSNENVKQRPREGELN
ncbi:hypothetical protein BJ508DRAFT_303698 [Ascobolus immersus RN42]|uniref:Uncharacterized protein n=1 Tax=Ascobolus immersus RN42 TaxID=1160509 RepID=A0A3N4ISK8_ASCIM|nr:hypothetical protein BJ508DRAFT_303698 [Ascobolus immersus RN42]